MEQNEIMRFLQEKASGADKEHEQAAVNHLVGLMDPQQRQPSKTDSRVQFLVDLTNRELAKEQNR